MRKAPALLAALVLTAAGSSVITAGPASAVTGCIWLDGVRPQGGVVEVFNWSFTCIPDNAGVPRWYPSVTPPPPPPPVPMAVAAPPAHKAAPMNDYDTDPHYEGYCVGDQYVTSSRRVIPDGQGGYYWTDPAALEKVQSGDEDIADQMVGAECHDSVLS